MKDRSVFTVFQLLLKKYGASDMLGGLFIGSLPAAMSMIFGPIISYKSDRHRGRWGRRIPYLFTTVPIAVVSTVGIAYSPKIGAGIHRLLGSHSPGLDCSILISFGVFWTVFSFASVTANAIYGGLVNDVVPASILGRFFGAVRALSLVAGFVFGFWLMGRAEDYCVPIFLGMAALYGVGFSLLCLNVKEGQYDPPPPKEPGQHRAGISATKDYLQECFGQTYYLWFYAAFGLASVAPVPVNLFGVYFAKSIQMNMDTYGKCIALTYVISLGLALPIGYLSDRFHPLRVSLATLVLYALVVLAGGFLARDAWSFGIALVAHGVISGCWLTATASLAQRLLPRDKFTQYNSAAWIIISVGMILVGPIVGVGLDWAHHVYRYIFLASLGLTLFAILCTLVLIAKFMKLGGSEHYVAPERPSREAPFAEPELAKGGTSVV